MSIILRGIDFLLNDHTALFTRLNYTAAQGEHINLIGNNGSGKSTLLRIMAGITQPHSGTVFTSSKPYYVPQHTGLQPELTVAEVLLVNEQLEALQAILRGEPDEVHYTRLRDAWDMEERVQHALHEWQLAHLSPYTRTAQLSGGEQTRLLLAGITLHAPQIVLLDEPTNHLDGAGRKQLQRFIGNYRGTLVVASHDRALLDHNQVTVALSEGRLVRYGGNYSFYQARHEEEVRAIEQDVHHAEKELKQARKQAQQAKERKQRQEGRDRQRSGIPRIVANTLKSNAEQSAAKLHGVHAEKIAGLSESLQQQRERWSSSQSLQLRFPASDLHAGKKLAEGFRLNYRYGELPLWENGLDFCIRSGDRIHIRGRNGSGKTTLLNLILGKLEPANGSIERASFGAVYLDQHYSIIDPEKTVLQQLSEHNRLLLADHELKTLLHQYQLPAGQWNKPCGLLSGGERMKLALCTLYVSGVHPAMIVLDEPVNNLDIGSMNVLADALREYNGTIVLVSHDETFAAAIGTSRTIDL